MPNHFALILPAASSTPPVKTLRIAYVPAEHTRRLTHEAAESKPALRPKTASTKPLEKAPKNETSGYTAVPATRQKAANTIDSADVPVYQFVPLKSLQVIRAGATAPWCSNCNKNPHNSLLFLLGLLFIAFCQTKGLVPPSGAELLFSLDNLANQIATDAKEWSSVVVSTPRRQMEQTSLDAPY